MAGSSSSMTDPKATAPEGLFDNDHRRLTNIGEHEHDDFGRHAHIVVTDEPMAIPAAAGLDELQRAVVKRHTEATICGAPFRLPGTRERPGRMGTCGYRERHPLHDLYPDHTKRDPLRGLYREQDRHEYQPVGRGICAADEDDWPCAARQLATEVGS